MIDEKQLRQSTNTQVIATMILIDEIRQLKEMIGVRSSLVFLDEKTVDKPVENVDKNKKPMGRPRKVTK